MGRPKYKQLENISDWGTKMQKHASGISDDANNPGFLKKYKSTVTKLKNTTEIINTLVQFSGGISAALGVFDFFFGSSKATIPTGYSHNCLN